MKRFVIVIVVVALAGCSKTVSIDLKLVEPCDQKNQALNGVSSFVISSSGLVENDTVSFSKDDGPAPLNLGLGDAVITAQAFADDVSNAGASGSIPQSIGRTMPIHIAENTGDVSAVVLTGKLDGFGKTTSEEGSCTSMTATAPVQGRHGHTATFVPQLNKVLIFGGAVFLADGSEGILNTAELYDPATGAFEALPDLDASGGAGGRARAYHQATALPDGRVIITGGFGVNSGHRTTLSSGVIFDPIALGAETPYRAFTLHQARAHHTSTLMKGAGVVVLMGGCSGTAEDDGCDTNKASTGDHGDSTNPQGAAVITEVFDITQPTGSLAPVQVPAASGLLNGRAFHQATSLENEANTILVVTGGSNANGPVSDIEIFRATGGQLEHVSGADLLATFPADQVPVRHTAVAIDAQRLVIIGGQTQAANGVPSGAGSANCWFFSTTAGIGPTPLKLFGQGGRVGALASQLSDGSILVVGGATTAGPDGLAPPTAEVLRPEAATGVLTAQTLNGPPLGQTRDHAAMAILPSNQVLYSGGHTTVAPLTTTNSAEIYFGP